MSERYDRVPGGAFVARIHFFGSPADFDVVLCDPEYLKILEEGINRGWEDLLGMRNVPFYSKYRPNCNFGGKFWTCGCIFLLDREIFHPGESAIVLVWTLRRASGGLRYGVGSKYLIHEGSAALGVGQVLAIINEDEGFCLPSMAPNVPPNPTSAS